MKAEEILAPEVLDIEEAHTIAEHAYNQYGRVLAQAAETHGVPAHWLVGLTAVENPGCHVWPDYRSYRRQPRVEAWLGMVLEGNPLRPSYDGVKMRHLEGVSTTALPALCNLYGQTMLPGYYVLTHFNVALRDIVPSLLLSHQDANDPPTITHLRDPQLHYFFAAYLLAHHPDLRSQLNSYRAAVEANEEDPKLWPSTEVAKVEEGALANVAHIWKRGAGPDGEVSSHLLEVRAHNAWLVSQMYVGIDIEQEERPMPSWLRRKGSGRFDVSLESFVRENLGPDEEEAGVPRDILEGVERTRKLIEQGPQTHTVEVNKGATVTLSPLVITNVEGAVVYTSREAPYTFFVIDPNLPLPTTASSPLSRDTLAAVPECNMGVSHDGQKEGHFFDLSDADGWHGIGPTPTEVALKAGAFDSALKGKFIDPEDLTRQILRERGWDDVSKLLDETPTTTGPQTAFDPTILTNVLESITKPGHKTSEGVMVGALFAVLGIATALNWVTPTQANEVKAQLANLAPLLIFVPVLWHFITSRGKLKSNTVRALGTDPAATIQGFGGFGKLGKILTDSRVRTGMEIGGALGVPGVGAASEILDRVTGTGGGSPDNGALLEQLARLNSRIVDVERDIKRRSEEMGRNADGYDREFKHVEEYLGDISQALFVLARRAGIHFASDDLKASDAVKRLAYAVEVAKPEGQ